MEEGEERTMRLLFDLDGTLTDPFVGITSCIQYGLTKLGRTPPPAKELTWCIGPPLRQSFLTLLETDDVDLAEKAVSFYRERFGEVGLFENELYPGISEVLEVLHSQGYEMSVATSKPTIYAKRIVEHFGLSQWFLSVDGVDIKTSHTGKSALIADVMKRDQLRADKTLMIGDRLYDVLGAAENGISTIGVRWGHGEEGELEKAGARLCVDRPDELIAAIQELKIELGHE